MTPKDHLRGVLVALTGFVMLVLGAPGLDMLGPHHWKPGSAERERVLTEFWGAIAVAAADVNRTVRMPLVGWLTPVQRPLRLAQSWSLYGGGPPGERHFEILVDDQLVFRTHDPEHRWLRSELRYRRIRPILDAHCSQNSRNSRGLVAWIVRRAREDFPEATVVESVCVVRGPQAAPGELDFRQRQVAEAPDWKPHP